MVKCSPLISSLMRRISPFPASIRLSAMICVRRCCDHLPRAGDASTWGHHDPERPLTPRSPTPTAACPPHPAHRRGVRLPGTHVWADVFTENRKGVSGVPAIAEEHQAHGRERPRADRPIGDLARYHKAGGQVEPHVTRMGELLRSRHRHQKRTGRSTTTPLCGCAGGCASSTRSGDARAGLIHSRTSTGTSGSYACAGLGTTCRG